jgi:segregation and condensation protein A
VTAPASLDPASAGASVPAGEQASEQAGGGMPAAAAFQVTLDQFEGPFDLLLQLIARHRLDVTVLALHQVTDDFLAWISSQGSDWDLDRATEFLVVAATLLDLKAARLLPSGEVEDEEDIAYLEARDLLFARLLQYRAFKEAAALLAERMSTAGRRQPRSVGLDPRFAALLPEVLLALSPQDFAVLAARALTPRPTPLVGLSHLHVPAVSVREQAVILTERLRRSESVSFRSLIADAGSTMVVVGRFLALLELFREGAIAFEQVTPLGDLRIRWTADDTTAEIEISNEFDEQQTEGLST